MAEIVCSRGEVVLIDDEDYPVISRHSWAITYSEGNASSHKRSYALTTLNTYEGAKKTVMMHNLIMGFGKQIDHVNGNTFDNRKCNLRRATHQENGWNKGKPKGGRFGKPASQYKGVSRCISRDGTVYWRVIIKLTAKGVVPAKFVRLGPFNSEIAAARAYNEEIVKHRGEFAWVNPISTQLA